MKLVKINVRSGKVVKKGASQKLRKARKLFFFKKLCKLKRVWRVAPIQTLVAHHGINLEAELTAALMRSI